MTWSSVAEPFDRRRRVRGVAGDPDDDALLRGLYAAHAGPLLGYVLALTGGDRGRAEDVVQETLLRAWQHPEALAPERGSPRAWLATVARNLVRDGVRARRSRPVEVAVIAEEAVAPTGDPEALLLTWEVLDAMEALSPEHRAAIVETYVYGRTVTQAAQVLGIPAGTVKSRTYYGLRALRLALEERGVRP
ncbi:MAG: sigma-70 family RNA polymerase sigma factor [Actinomycetes bacterium]